MKKVNFNALLKNEKVMYVVLFVTAMSAFGYLMARNVEAITLMAAIGFLTWNFSKNMTIVLGTALLVTNMVYGVRRFEGFKEGDANLNEATKEEEDEPKPCQGDDCAKDAMTLMESMKETKENLREAHTIMNRLEDITKNLNVEEKTA